MKFGRTFLRKLFSLKKYRVETKIFWIENRNYLTHFFCFLMDACLMMNHYMRTIRVFMSHIKGKINHCRNEKVFHRFLYIQIFQHFPSPCYLIFIRILESALISNHNQAGIIDIYKEEKQIIDNYFRWFIYSPNKKDAYYGIETMLCRSRFHRLRLPSNMIKKISETFRKKYKIKHILVEKRIVEEMWIAARIKVWWSNALVWIFAIQ